MRADEKIEEALWRVNPAETHSDFYLALVGLPSHVDTVANTFDPSIS